MAVHAKLALLPAKTAEAPAARRDAPQDAHAHPRPNPCRHLTWLRTALPAFDRAGIQGRDKFRGVPADHLRRSGRYGCARAYLQLRRGEGGAGQVDTSTS
jgi:hypothetical protein